ncbi:rhodanese-like domain-containing protein [Bacteriovorax sp. DB6_IX]|uniref:rhodanese-like domain-containing protein n=1 Tax=Bacteriovorax sp. DB6_IX TaxID=1353530 RepID=UPI000389EED4|nr:rhodanese-like domain-containing protein [Bacteriovorax sp. DB6_IX]EQC47958.1 rhodanese-like protein [Bacteriovorax sp. DB6_IX]
MINSMNATELKNLIDNNDEFILVDCREQGEWNEGHIKEAIFIPLSNFQELWGDKLTNKDAKIVMQCRSGKRSLNACMLLMHEGFTNLHNLEGGILDWQANGYEVVQD